MAKVEREILHPLGRRTTVCPQHWCVKSIDAHKVFILTLWSVLLQLIAEEVMLVLIERCLTVHYATVSYIRGFNQDVFADESTSNGQLSFRTRPNRDKTWNCLSNAAADDGLPFTERIIRGNSSLSAAWCVPLPKKVQEWFKENNIFLPDSHWSIHGMDKITRSDPWKL